MDQAQYDRLLSNLRTGKWTPESENYVIKKGQLYYTVLTDKHVKKELQVRSQQQFATATTNKLWEPLGWIDLENKLVA